MLRTARRLVVSLQLLNRGFGFFEFEREVLDLDLEVTVLLPQSLVFFFEAGAERVVRRAVVFFVGCPLFVVEGGLLLFEGEPQFLVLHRTAEEFGFKTFPSFLELVFEQVYLSLQVFVDFAEFLNSLFLRSLYLQRVGLSFV